MNIRTILTLASALFLAALGPATEYNLQELARDEGLALHNRQCKTVPQEAPGTVYLTQAGGDGIAWINDVNFADGEIEVKVRGRDRPGASFLGVAFHGQDDTTYDAVYLRPFNFRNRDRKDHALQYVSLPRFHWKQLRDAHPGKYESSLTPAPAPDAFVTLKLVIVGDSLAVHIDDSDTPELEVDLIGEHRSGKVGLWVGNGSDGEFKELSIRSRDE